MQGRGLERDLAPQLAVARAVHLSHPPGGQGGEDLVVAEDGAPGWSGMARAIPCGQLFV